VWFLAKAQRRKGIRGERFGNSGIWEFENLKIGVWVCIFWGINLLFVLICV